ncbi:uncharacterized protein CLUP02_15651 [Colletotrichum lupini]|uniref:Uncharacterized protein n=1 Tax=Colletotrichum lupini TaxID=145971 RepID=A0A9Q8T6Z3_9PEZI|nr:uncharacterized protein CLUP02_15651 [Colletotrichum lupini]UQC90120.1 hypothetical protein CLUP02_15651 [Colletotrichum lupini]
MSRCYELVLFRFREPWLLVAGNLGYESGRYWRRTSVMRLNLRDRLRCDGSAENLWLDMQKGPIIVTWRSFFCTDYMCHTTQPQAMCHNWWRPATTVHRGFCPH